MKEYIEEWEAETQEHPNFHHLYCCCSRQTLHDREHHARKDHHHNHVDANRTLKEIVLEVVREVAHSDKHNGWQVGGQEEVQKPMTKYDLNWKSTSSPMWDISMFITFNLLNSCTRPLHVFEILDVIN